MKNILLFFLLLMPVPMLAQGGSGSHYPGQGGPGVGFEGIQRDRDVNRDAIDSLGQIGKFVFLIIALAVIYEIGGGIVGYIVERKNKQ